MRTALLSILLVMIGYGAGAQLSLQPRIGFENAFPKISYNNLQPFSATDQFTSPQAALRLDYKFKKWHGPFLGVSTSRTGVDYNLSDGNGGLQIYNMTKANYRVSISGGYEITTKPIYFKKPASKPSAKMVMKNADVNRVVIIKKSCGSKTNKARENYSYRSNCSKTGKTPAGKNNEIMIKEVIVRRVPEKMKAGWFIQLQPSAGLAYVPFANNGVDVKTRNGVNNVTYKAGNYNTAFITGGNIMFGKERAQKFLVSVNYFKGIGAFGDRTITTPENGKTNSTHFSSDVSGWSMSVGIPINLLHKKSPPKKVVEEKIFYKKECERTYKTNCQRRS